MQNANIINRYGRYLRRRPFLVITTIHRPAAGVRTERKGWGDVATNWSTFEQPSVVDHVSRKAMREATVIIDIAKGVAVKNRYTGTEAESVVGHYLEKYRPQIIEAMNIWITREANTRAREMRSATAA